jgi:hypothetical protein
MPVTRGIKLYSSCISPVNTLFGKIEFFPKESGFQVISGVMEIFKGTPVL